MSPIARVCACSEYFTTNDAGELCLIPGSQGLRDILYFEDPGTYQFEKADYPWLARIRVKVQAGGGGAAGAQAPSGSLVAQPGGAGGGYSESLIEVTSLGAVETVVVGVGGTAGGPSSDGGPGGNSSFGGLVTANGGAGGQAVMAPGGTIVCYSGTAGPLAGMGDLRMGGGAGGGAIRLGNFEGQSGEGGGSFLGQGGTQKSSNGGGGGSRGFGGGAAGGFARDGSSTNGTEGGSGIVIIELHG